MGYALCIGNCAVCGYRISFNPVKVPAVLVEGKREPVCGPCMRLVNMKRIERDLQPFTIAADAYEACPEEEL